MNSNFRQFYFKERWFYIGVIDKEDPGPEGYSFKVSVFHVSLDPSRAVEQEKALYNKLSQFNAEDIRISTRDKEKFRAFCRIKSKIDAKNFYSGFARDFDPP